MNKIYAACAALLLTTAGWAAPGPAKDAYVTPCKADAQKFCSGFTPSQGLRNCLREHVNELDGQCKAALAEPVTTPPPAPKH
ncbi:hypothetical protein EV700_1504 [Fluviicoccus keumensis]|uniref:Cysteine rich repeat protein n=1 Tax=Fluviicoccus keumensis TaxID=1435465 RepID=A0A4Q7ZB04_9GAMM|nr:cysteine rich repeat-containing protein [Fluviicoccus keumensis]RZU47113.1 hypothetical protein EV700_1504 [Fluviicoccus keumensis]